MDKTPINPWTGINYRLSPVLCLDLDDTIRTSKSEPGGFIKGPDDILVFPDVQAKLAEYKTKNWLIFGITNQAGVAYGHKTETDVLNEWGATRGLLNVPLFADIVYAMCHSAGKVEPFNHRTFLRKPEIGMLAVVEFEALRYSVVVDWNNSLVVGDHEDDKQLASIAKVPFMWAWEFFGREKP